MYSIGEFSERTGIPVSTLRFYDAKGILVPEIKKANGYRYYSDEQVVLSIFINNMKSLDMPLETIHDMLDVEDPLEVVKAVRNQKYALLESVKRLNTFELYYNNPQVAMARSNVDDAQITTGFLEGFMYFAADVEYEGKEFKEFLSEYATPLLLLCYNRKGVRQEAGMRIICNRLYSGGPDSLIVPIDNYDGSAEIEDVPSMETQKTARIVLRKKEMEFDEDMEKFIKRLEVQGYKMTGVPIVELLIDSGDLPGMDGYIAAFHVPVK